MAGATAAAAPAAAVVVVVAVVVLLVVVVAVSYTHLDVYKRQQHMYRTSKKKSNTKN